MLDHGDWIYALQALRQLAKAIANVPQQRNQRQIQEINTGILIAGGADLKRWLAKLTNNNAQGEYYITDIIAMAHQEGHQIVAVHPQRLSEVEGVNNRLQLARGARLPCGAGRKAAAGGRDAARSGAFRSARYAAARARCRDRY
ncbi:hypothetical protein KPZU09_52120 [Klebsiella pneumoniae]|uniref:Uncharacterized protein n=1 Tax=Klebsiella pneumoniae TaxID=573 RepID=A0A919HVF0_KLEPN|nr:hypothetical protein KPZU09_52120 [Klebsiella pneumoniae]